MIVLNEIAGFVSRINGSVHAATAIRSFFVRSKYSKRSSNIGFGTV